MSNLIVGGPGHQWIVNELNRVDLQHVEDDLGVLRIVLIPAVVQSFLRLRQTDGGHKLQLETVLSEMVRQDTVIIADRFKPDPHRQVVAGEIYG